MIRLWFGILCCVLSLSASCCCHGSPERQLLVAVVVREVAGPSTLPDHLRNVITPQQQPILFDSTRTDVIVHVVPGDWEIKGAWTLLPLFPRLSEIYPNATWLAFLRETTRVDWNKLVRLTRQFDSTKEWFIGHELCDKEPTIVHHFAFHHDPSAFKYPAIEAGVLLSQPVLKRIGAKIAGQGFGGSRDFAIDVQHELALYMTEVANLTHSPAFCLQPAHSCATWKEPFGPCGDVVDPSRLFFAVKTCSKFHEDRVPVVRRTWARQAPRLAFFSDVEDESLPTVSLGVANTDSGHCSKTMAIIDHLGALSKTAGGSALMWFVIADDDTILGVRELRELLSCYDSSRPLLIGQKYGYAAGQSYGYDYITGGGGMVLSRAAVELLTGHPNCRCPRPDTPDDMWLGACAEALGISIIHFPGFHQARPDDYPLPLLRSQHVISFHKHWMIDPIQVYTDWFKKDVQTEQSKTTSSAYTRDPTGDLLEAASTVFDQQQRLPDEL